MSKYVEIVSGLWSSVYWQDKYSNPRLVCPKIWHISAPLGSFLVAKRHKNISLFCIKISNNFFLDKINGLDNLEVFLYARSNHTDDGIHSDNNYPDTLGIPITYTLKILWYSSLAKYCNILDATGPCATIKVVHRFASSFPAKMVQFVNTHFTGKWCMSQKSWAVILTIPHGND